MKPRNYFILPIVAAGAVSFTSCGKKDVVVEAPEGAVTEEVAAFVEGITEAVAQPAGSLDELAAKAGFAQYLSKETTAMWTFYDGAGLAQKMRGSKVGEYLNSLAEAEGESLDELFAGEEFQKFAEVAGEEMFLALGDGGAAELDHLMVFSKKSNFYQFESLVKILGSQLSGDDSGASVQQAEEYIINLFKDKEMIAAAEAVEMPPMFVGFKVSDAEKRKAFVEQLQGFGGMALDSQDEGEEFMELAEKDGFTGFTVKGDMLVKLLESDEEQLAEMKKELGEEALESYMAALAKKSFTTLAGEYNDYVVLFAGSSVEQLSFAATPADSVLAHKGMDFAKNYSSKELVSLMYINDAYAQLSVKYQAVFKYIVEGTLSGLEKSDSFGDTRILEVLLNDLLKSEDAFFAPYSAGRSGMVAFLEEGFKIDSFYAGNAPAADLKSKRHLSGVAEMEDVLFSANWVSHPAQVELGLEYIDAIGSTMYQMAKQVSGLNIEGSSDFAQFKMGFGMADGMFKNDLVSLWSALRTDLNQGLGAEAALVIDTKGELPTVPMIPEEMIKKGKMPRFGYVSTVKDRSKISESWTKINAVAESSLKKVGQMTGAEIPMQRPFKSVSNGLTSWTFQIPFTHQNCAPTISVSDDLFIAGSSTDFAAEIASVYQKEATGAPLSEMTLNFDAVRELASDWLTLVDAHSAGFMNASQLKDFQEMKPIIEGVLKASDELQSFSVKTFESNGELQSKLHLKMR